MKERGILFSAPMVRSILAGTKTQTRRVVKLPSGCEWDGVRGGSEVLCSPPGLPTGARVVRCPYGVPGDRLWVRERCYEGTHSGGRPWVRYAADDDNVTMPEGTRWRPSIHMHRWASRIDLEITEVRVQRLQDITEADARAEGVAPRDGDGHRGYVPARDRYALLWDQINGAGSWDSDPWVWALSFKRVKP